MRDAFAASTERRPPACDATRWAALVALLLTSACTRRPPLLEAPPSPPPPADGALHVSLTWAAPVDLDLYVTDPVAETLYFANNPTRAGARLERDGRCATLRPGAGSLEAAQLPTPAPGRYRVGVDYIDACGAALDTVPFRVAVDRGGQRREADGSVRRGEFKVIVLEFEVDENGSLRQ